ncbi:hypothetical protein MSAN_00654500 [Mycena sanguinolenta]|uniref:Uncharacterized protein n=1 Tax=Mycena sanguinolenta TaxID=230812 RepID=A0A8H6Z3X1_9AGAR|nr:hypothetical protein MSAN_00654500 [Mycena sanguinolenta]
MSEMPVPHSELQMREKNKHIRPGVNVEVEKKTRCTPTEMQKARAADAAKQDKADHDREKSKQCLAALEDKQQEDNIAYANTANYPPSCMPKPTTVATVDEARGGVKGDDIHSKNYKSEMDFVPKQVLVDGQCQYEDFMSGNWAWWQADIIVEDPATHRSTFVPVILSSNKTTVSVATGQNEYYPLYMSNGLVHNGVRRAHCNAVSLIGFLATPKSLTSLLLGRSVLILYPADREHKDSNEFRTFHHNLFHGSLRYILQSLKPGTTAPEVTLFGDGHYHHVIYGLGPYIADYPEQVLLACVVQGWCPRCTASSTDLDGLGSRRSQLHTEALFEALDHGQMWDDYGIIPGVLPFTWDFPRADIHELLLPDLLHQVIKGTFKDHLVAWVDEYLDNVHGKTEAKKTMADIDRQIAAGFKQWTGDNSKALMKVYLPAIKGHVPNQMVRAFSAFLDFCYLVHHNVIDEVTLDARSTQHSHAITASVSSLLSQKCPEWALLLHYRIQAHQSGQTAVAALKLLSSVQVDFAARGMMQGPSARPLLVGDPPLCPAAAADEDDDGSPSNEWKIIGEVLLAKKPMRTYPRNPAALAQFLNLPDLVPLVRCFLYLQDHPDHNLNAPLPLDHCPDAPRSIRVFPSAITKFYAPSDQSGIHGMLHGRIRAVHSWRGGAA